MQRHLFENIFSNKTLFYYKTILTTLYLIPSDHLQFTFIVIYFIFSRFWIYINLKMKIKKQQR
ncbi:hypothetical protein KSU1_D0642 [Candidatus Jettenia caeni]|uniref:Uncharacterized protein n=1 Tax=Candidatus Jettenia caeni TaxID=247490 RepID=I3IQF6_9BACT|nr:hypothetical protein KSU1_D0642 [Candidatus Jettenia caeni]